MQPSVSDQAGAGGKRRLASFGAPALLFVICAGFFWKLVLTNQYTWLEGPDLAYQVLPWLQVQAGEWHRGRVALWDPYLWGGQSLIGQAQPGVAYPLNWLLFLMPLKNGWLRQSLLHWYFVVIHFMAAWFAYLLCRDLKRTRAASVAGGCVFALGGWVGVTDWPQMLNSAVWAPLVFLYLLRSLRGVRPVASAAAAGAFFGMAWLGGHHQIPIFVALASGGVWFYHIFRRGWPPDWTAARLAAVFLLFLFAVSALQTLPAYEYGKLAVRWVNASHPVGWKDAVPYSVHSQFSLIPSSLLSIVLPGYARNADPFIGLTALTLALLAVAMAWKEPSVKLFAAVAAGGLLFSLGRNNVFHGILYAVVPMVEKARTPSFAVFIYHFGIAILCAYGIDSYLSAPESPWPRRAWRALLVLASVVFAVTAALTLGQKAPGDDRFLVVALVGLLAAALLYAWRRGHLPQSTAVALATGLMLMEFGNLAGIFWPNKDETERKVYLSRMAQHHDIAQYLLNVPWPVRMEVSDQDIPYNFGDWYGIDQFGGFVASLPVNLVRLPPHTPRSKQLFGVNYTVKREAAGPNQELVFESSSGLKVYWNRDAFPRAWTVHEAVRVKTAPEIQAIMDGGDMDLRRRTFLMEEPPPMEQCAGTDQARVIKRNSLRVVIEADMACRGMVMLGDSYFPGWRATVDGKPARIYEAYTAIRGVMAGKGRHTIDMRYQPAPVIAGGALTLLGVAGAIALNLSARRREARRI